MLALAAPSNFIAVDRVARPVVVAVAVAAFAVAVPLALNAPQDAQQGGAARIMFVHVPAAWIALAAYAVLALASACHLVAKLPLADIVAKNVAPLGACFAALALVTGSVWGKPMWGVWWVWDPRIASMFVLLLLLLGYLALRQALGERRRSSKIAAVAALIGALDLPVIKFSVEWWRSLHQPASLRLDRNALADEFLMPLLLMTLAYAALLAALAMSAIRADIAKKRLERLNP